MASLQLKNVSGKVKSKISEQVWMIACNVVYQAFVRFFAISPSLPEVARNEMKHGIQCVLNIALLTLPISDCIEHSPWLLKAEAL